MLLIKNIKSLITLNSDEEESLGAIDDAALVINKDCIHWYGKEEDLPSIHCQEILDANQCIVMPGLIDCHTHFLFGGKRANEFGYRMNNLSYEEIHKRGGGIYKTVQSTKEAKDEELLAIGKLRLNKILKKGVTTIEAKSGYGLNVADEVRALRLLKILNNESRIDIHSTFLGAHIIPKEFKSCPRKYIEVINNEMLPLIKEENLARDCDVFCETGAFSKEDASALLKKASDLGFSLKAHVQQISYSDGVQLLNDFKLNSISHADYLTQKDIDLIASKNVVVEALPIAALFLRSKEITPIKKLAKKNIKIAVATDYNPGTAMCDNLLLAARLFVTYFHGTIQDALKGITKHAAYALGRHDIGVLKSKGTADLVITNCRTIDEIFYDWTKHPISRVIKKGKVIQ